MSYIWQAITTTLSQILIVLGPVLVLACAMNYVAGFVERRAYRILGRGWYLGLFGWLGTVTHELGHAVFCIIFGHTITEIKLFEPDPLKGSLGYVSHSYNRDSNYQLIGLFFIGLGPILFGTAVLLFFTYLLLDLNILNTTNDIRIMSSDLGSWQAFTQMFGNLGRTSASFFTGIFSWNNLLSWQFYVFLYLTFAIGSSITLSRADLEGVWEGFGALVGLIFLFNLATLWIGDFAADLITAIASYFGVFSSIMFLVILLNIVVAGLILLPPRFVPTVARVTRSTFRRSRYD